MKCDNHQKILLNMQSMSDFPNKMTSLGEVQRIIGLSLSKIQMGRNQRGGLPLHKNLLVATVLNKARDLYMQETMYMNYKMMTGQFGTGVGGMPNSCLVDHSNMSNREEHEEEMEDTPEHEEYDEDSESDVEDDCDITSNTHKHNHLNQNHHYHHNVNQLQNSLNSNASMNMGHASPCTSSMAAAMMMRAAAANANSMAAAAAASAASAASSSMGNSTDSENNSISGCSSFNALNVNNSAVNSGVVNNCFSQMSSMNMGMHMLQQQHQQLQQQQSQVPDGRNTNNQMQHPQQSHFNGMPSHYAGMMPFFHHQQQMLLHHQQQQQQQQQISNNESGDETSLDQSQEEQKQHVAVAAMATQAAQVQAASLAAAAARAAVVNNVAVAAAAASTAINVGEDEIQQHRRKASSSASSTSGSSHSSSNDEGFIDEPDCDCDTQNFSNTASDVRVPFQYCYHCAPFHPSNGRGPTLVPTPPTTPCTTTSEASSSVLQAELVEAKDWANDQLSTSDSSSESSSTIKQNNTLSSENSPNMTSSEEEKTQQCTKMPIEVLEENTSVTQTSQQQTIEHDGGANDTNNNSSQACEQNFTIYDMDSKSTERRSPCEFPATLRGTKRRRISGSETPDTVSMFKEGTECPNGLQTPNKRRRRSDGEDEEEERSSTSSEEGDTRESMEQSLCLKETSSLFNDSGYHGETSNNEVRSDFYFLLFISYLRIVLIFHCNG